MATYFAYERCTDLAATRHFYGDLLGLPVIWEGEHDVSFRHDCVQLSFGLADGLARPDGWAFQPGWSLGQLPDAPPTLPIRCISIALPPEGFQAAVARLQAAGVESLRPEPFWVGYWGFVVKDPDGQTVEISDATSPGPEGTGD